MTATAEAKKTSAVQNAGMGQAVVGRGGDALVAVLGSCIGVALHHPRHRVGALAHVVLPDSANRTGPPAKFADTAVPYLLQLLKNEGLATAGLIVKLAGGASMFASSGPMQIGAANLEAVAAALEKAGLRVAAQDVGGPKGRRITLDCQTGELAIEVAGMHTATL
jgi:chemotaxis protein CheD